MNNSGDIEFIVAWDAVKDREWQMPDGLSRNWLTNLPADPRVPMSNVIDLLAFGAAMQPDGLTNVDKWGARILATRVLSSGVASGAIIIYGQRVELLNIGALGALPLKRLGLYGRIDAQEFANNALTVSPFNPKWLSPTFIARDRALWGEREAVSHIDLTVDRDPLGGWFNKLSGIVARNRGRPLEFPWDKMEKETIRLMNYNGEFCADDPLWNAQARLEEKLRQFCTKMVQREPSESQLRARIRPWIEKWRQGRKLVSGYSG